MKGIVNLLPLAAVFGLLWIALIRPTRQRQQQAVRLRSEVAVGQHVVTTSGLHATVRSVQDEVVVLETSPGITSRWALGAIGRIEDATDETSDTSG